jgi:hypothetical protein
VSSGSKLELHISNIDMKLKEISKQYKILKNKSDQSKRDKQTAEFCIREWGKILAYQQGKIGGTRTIMRKNPFADRNFINFMSKDEQHFLELVESSKQKIRDFKQKLEDSEQAINEFNIVKIKRKELYRNRDYWIRINDFLNKK